MAQHEDNSNDQDTWDYTNLALSWQVDAGGNPYKRQRNPGLLADHPEEYGGGPHGGYHGHYHDDAYGPPTPHYEGHRMVVMVYGLDPIKMNCDRVFNVFCLYGNVEGVKFMKSKPGACMVEMGDGYAVDRAITHLNNNFMFGQRLSVFKVFSDPRNNRFSSLEQAAKNRIQQPSNVLHFFNAPPEVSEQNLFEICDELGLKKPSSVKVFSGKSERSSSGLPKWESKSHALKTLGLLNHSQMKNPNGPYPYTIPIHLCFSTAQHAS
uniref:RRM domain-containing protein n=1 Tax=Pyxicephalus adspersus TaxID=30357 RepID=A0AAV3AYE0_PYXAD|nr:TPA: hypothetical protein GDO54_001622 [Pyxicephalus adspersus]